MLGLRSAVSNGWAMEPANVESSGTQKADEKGQPAAENLHRLRAAV